MTILNWGILSTGTMCDWFCSDFYAVHNGKLAAVCSRSQQNANDFAAKYSIPKAFANYDEMLNDPEIDIIYIGTPHTAHKQNILDAFAAGKNVYCEKPVVTNVADAEEVIAASKASGLFFGEAMWTWHLPAMIKAKEWVTTGRIGKLVHVKTDFGYPIPYSLNRREYDKSDAGGALREMGIYPIAIANYFIGCDPEEVKVVHQNAPNGVEDDMIAIFKHGDVAATLGTSFRCRLRNAAHIIGTDGYIVIPDAFRCHEATLFQLDIQIDKFSAPRKERGYHYQAIQTAIDVQNGLKESSVVPLSSSLTFQKHMQRILLETGRGEN